jgi:hypothetical protein
VEAEETVLPQTVHQDFPSQEVQLQQDVLTPEAVEAELLQEEYKTVRTEVLEQLLLGTLDLKKDLEEL